MAHRRLSLPFAAAVPQLSSQLLNVCWPGLRFAPPLASGLACESLPPMRSFVRYWTA